MTNRDVIEQMKEMARQYDIKVVIPAQQPRPRRYRSSYEEQVIRDYPLFIDHLPILLDP